MLRLRIDAGCGGIQGPLFDDGTFESEPFYYPVTTCGGQNPNDMAAVTARFGETGIDLQVLDINGNVVCQTIRKNDDASPVFGVRIGGYPHAGTDVLGVWSPNARNAARDEIGGGGLGRQRAVREIIDGRARG